MRQFILLPIVLLTAAPAAADPRAEAQTQADPWHGVRVAQAGPNVIYVTPDGRRVLRDSDAPRGRPDFAAQPPRGQYGGGFIEYLFTGREYSPYGQQLPRPEYMRPQYDRRDLYSRRDAYDYDRYGRDRSLERGGIIQARRDYPDVAARPQNRIIDPRFLPQEVAYSGKEMPGTIVIDTRQRFLYLVEDGGRAMRYGVGVGREGFGWSGVKTITEKREWPDWRPPEEMLKRRPDLPRYMAGGPDNPLGARALYLGDSLYRIHGSNEPWTIGQAVSSGCFRMRNEDVIDLYDRVKVGTKVVVI
jgi:lipoprotein-anchoring transpeptidase ErfK/SrfK